MDRKVIRFSDEKMQTLVEKFKPIIDDYASFPITNQSVMATHKLFTNKKCFHILILIKLVSRYM